MALTDLQIINLGLGKISSSRVRNINPPTTPLERHVAEGYQHWRRSELQKHRWVFATVDDYALTQSEILDETRDYRKYKYDLPVDCLRPVRFQGADWKQRGRALYDRGDTLTIDYIADVPESEFDPLFVEVLACRVAMESVEYVTQSNTKEVNAVAKYDEAVSTARQNNAFIVGSEAIGADDYSFPFIADRY